MKGLWITQGIVDIVLILIIIGYRTVLKDVLKSIDALNKFSGKVKDLAEQIELLRKSILGR
jgi:hypothetical protein